MKTTLDQTCADLGVHRILLKTKPEGVSCVMFGARGGHSLAAEGFGPTIEAAMEDACGVLERRLPTAIVDRCRL